MDWLFEGHSNVYLLLGVVGVGFFVMWWRDRMGHWLAGLAAVALLALMYIGLDRAVETRREQIARKLYEMAAAVARKDVKAIAAHLSPQFRFGSASRERFLTACAKRLDQGWVDAVAVWDVRVGEGAETVLFAKPKGGPASESHFLVRTRWVLDPDGQWRMAGFTVHNPFVDTQSPLPLPELTD